jgi:hypothetical protein
MVAAGTEVAWRAGDSGEVLLYRNNGTSFEVLDDKIMYRAVFVPGGRIVVVTADDHGYPSTLELVGLDGSGRRTLVFKPYRWAARADGVIFQAPQVAAEDPAVLCWMPYDGSEARALAGFRSPGELAAYSDIDDPGSQGPDGPLLALAQ